MKRLMESMELTIEGILKRAAILEIFCGILNDKNGKKGKKVLKPSFTAEYDNAGKKSVKVTGTYSSRNGFEFVQ